jgi:RNA polymerase sigma-70 factor (ECF subfamily)
MRAVQLFGISTGCPETTAAASSSATNERMGSHAIRFPELPALAGRIPDAGVEPADRMTRASDSSEPPDEALVPQVATGDAAAFALLFRRRHGEIYRFALHMTGSPATAEDVTQDVFLAVMRDAHRFDPARGNVPAWLCGIARNFVRRRFERDRAMLPLEDEAGDGDLPPVVEDPLGDLTRAERLEVLRRAISSLPLRYREVVVLCDLQEMNYTDAAAALGCALGTVRSRLHRARALLAVKVAAAETRAAPAAAGRARRCIA